MTLGGRGLDLTRQEKYMSCYGRQVGIRNQSMIKMDRGMVVVFTATCAISVYHPQSCEFEPRSWRGVLDTTLCDKFVSDLRQVGGFLQVLQVLRLLPPIKLIATIQLKYQIQLA